VQAMLPEGFPFYQFNLNYLFGFRNNYTMSSIPVLLSLASVLLAGLSQISGTSQNSQTLPDNQFPDDPALLTLMKCYELCSEYVYLQRYDVCL